MSRGDGYARVVSYRFDDLDLFVPRVAPEDLAEKLDRSLAVAWRREVHRARSLDRVPYRRDEVGGHASSWTRPAWATLAVDLGSDRRRHVGILPVSRYLFQSRVRYCKLPGVTVDFYLGSPDAKWLEQAGVPLFLSRRKLERRRIMPRAIAPWSLDSGGFTELRMFGEWRLAPIDYVKIVRRCRDEIGLMRWAVPQDWMCGPALLKRTGFGVLEHQRRTINNYLELLNLAPDVPWIPVLQGLHERDYLDHVDQYARAGVDLTTSSIVGLGSVVYRETTSMVAATADRLAADGIRLHGFGIKARGLLKCAHSLVSADSHAWAMTAHFHPAMPGHAHKKCKNCLTYALAWRDRVLRAIAQGKDRKHQLGLHL